LVSDGIIAVGVGLTGIVYIYIEGAGHSFTCVLIFLVIGGILLIMEKVCKNCEYFVQKSLHSDKYLWGDCQNPAIKEVSIDKKDVFKWGDGICPNFKPKKDRESTGHEDSQGH
jgi:hypothetical protein